MTTQPNEVTTDFIYSPLPGFIIVKPYKEEQPVSGVVIADTMKDKDSSGVVMAVGKDWQEYHTDGNVITVTSPVAVGDVVIYKNYGATRYLDFKTGEPIFALRFHYDPSKTDICAIIKK